MNDNNKESAVALAFIATVFAAAGIWFTSAPIAAKLASTSMLFVLWTIATLLAGRGRS